MTKTDRGETMNNDLKQEDDSLPTNTDPLPWLIHNLREKQPNSTPSPQYGSNEQQKDSP